MADNPEPQPAKDDRLMEQLRAAIERLDPVPEEAILAAQSSLAWLDMDAELAALSYDSLLDDDALAGVRSGVEIRSLTFETASFIVELEVADDPTLHLTGQLVPGGPAVIELRRPTGEPHLVEADALGRFATGPLDPGPLSLRVRPEGTETPVDTDWITI